MDFKIEKKWANWIVARNGNKPNPRALMHLAKIDRVNLNRYNKEQVKALAAKKTKSILKTYKQVLTPRIKQAFKVKMNDWATWAEKYTKLSTLYSVLPCKYRKVGYNTLEVQIPVPYQGVGTQTPYGFCVQVKTAMFPNVDGHEYGHEYGYDMQAQQYKDGHLTRSYGTLRLNNDTGTWHVFCKELEAMFYD